MKFGKIRIENGEFKFNRMMKSYLVPCSDIRWAYRRKEDANGKMCCGVATFTTNFVVIRTKMDKRYQFEMTEDEAKACLQYLKEANPDMIIGFPKGNALPLDSVFNTRDLGGFASEDGRHILPYQLLRSGELYHLSMSDQKLLREEYHLGTVVDFRTEAEQTKKPDAQVEQVLYIDNPILEEETLGITQDATFETMLEMLGDVDVDAYMMNMYQSLVLNRTSQNQFAKFLQYVVKNERGKSILWHCSLGKDRVGIATMLLLSALGVPRGSIMDDYMKTNICLQKEVEYLVRMLASKNVPDASINKMKSLFSAKERYMQSALNSIQSEYGSMERYLRKAVCLSAGNIKTLRDRYLI